MFVQQTNLEVRTSLNVSWTPVRSGFSEVILALAVGRGVLEGFVSGAAGPAVASEWRRVLGQCTWGAQDRPGAAIPKEQRECHGGMPHHAIVAAVIGPLRGSPHHRPTHTCHIRFNCDCWKGQERGQTSCAGLEQSIAAHFLASSVWHLRTWRKANTATHSSSRAAMIPWAAAPTWPGMSGHGKSCKHQPRQHCMRDTTPTTTAQQQHSTTYSTTQHTEHRTRVIQGRPRGLARGFRRCHWLQIQTPVCVSGSQGARQTDSSAAARSPSSVTKS